MRISREDFSARYQQQIDQQTESKQISPSPAGRSKYRNVLQHYDGRTYHSQAEARYAAELDLKLKAGQILGWEPQPRFVLLTASDRARLVLTRETNTYTADFLIHQLDGAHIAVDIKGYEKQRDRDMRALWAQFGPYPLHIIYPDRTVVIGGEEG